MVSRSFVGLLVLVLVLAFSVSIGAAQLKDGPKAPSKPAVSKTTDINSAPESELVALGIEKSVAKKIVDGRPYRNKRELVSRQLLTMEQYDKLKDHIIAKQSGGR